MVQTLPKHLALPTEYNKVVDVGLDRVIVVNVHPVPRQYHDTVP